MRTVLVLLAALAAAAEVDAQRRGAGGGGAATLAIMVTDEAGAPISGVLVTTEGPVSRSVRTEGGRIALEGLPAGNYRLRFEREGFLTLERELAAKGSAPIDVKVTLKPAPPPPAPVAPPAPEKKPPVDAKVVALDVVSVIEKESVGRAAGRTTPLACGEGASTSLIQVRQPLAEHTHAGADETLYVIAGEGTAQAGGASHKLQAGVLLFVPRGVPHALTQSGRNPLTVISMRAGEGCGL